MSACSSDIFVKGSDCCCWDATTKATKCCCSLWTNMASCCFNFCNTMCSLCLNAGMWKQILSSCFCCCCCCSQCDGGNGGGTSSTALKLAIQFPPLGVFCRYKFGLPFWICLALTLVGHLPGVFYAIYVLKLAPTSTSDAAQDGDCAVPDCC